MDINLAIQTLQTLSQNLGVQINALTLEQQAADTAVSQLQATLTTDDAALDAANAQIAALTAQLAAQSAPITP